MEFCSIWRVYFLILHFDVDSEIYFTCQSKKWIINNRWRELSKNDPVCHNCPVFSFKCITDNCICLHGKLPSCAILWKATSTLLDVIPPELWCYFSLMCVSMTPVCRTSKARHSSHWKKYIIFSIFCSLFAGDMNIVIKGIGLYCIQCSERGSHFSSCCCFTFFVLSELPGHKWVFCDYDSNAQQWYKIDGWCSSIWYQNRLRD